LLAVVVSVATTLIIGSAVLERFAFDRSHTPLP